jgi:hypothetical protein
MAHLAFAFHPPATKPGDKELIQQLRAKLNSQPLPFNAIFL